MWVSSTVPWSIAGPLIVFSSPMTVVALVSLVEIPILSSVPNAGLPAEADIVGFSCLVGLGRRRVHHFEVEPHAEGGVDVDAHGRVVDVALVLQKDRADGDVAHRA